MQHARPLTLVDKLKLRYDVKTDVWELVFQHAQEHGQEMIYRPNRLEIAGRGRLIILVLAQNRGQTTNLGTQSSADMLRRVRHEFLNVGHHVVKKCILV
jgi:hypothetical protein